MSEPKELNRYQDRYGRDKDADAYWERQWEHPPEDCQACGEPFNDADAPASGLCLACRADQEQDELAAEAAHRDELRDWEDERGTP